MAERDVWATSQAIAPGQSHEHFPVLSSLSPSLHFSDIYSLAPRQLHLTFMTARHHVATPAQSRPAPKKSPETGGIEGRDLPGAKDSFLGMMWRELRESLYRKTGRRTEKQKILPVICTWAPSAPVIRPSANQRAGKPAQRAQPGTSR